MCVYIYYVYTAALARVSGTSEEPAQGRLVRAAGPAWAWGTEDRSNIETEMPSHVEIEYFDHSLVFHPLYLCAC